MMEEQKKRGKLEQIPCSFMCLAGTALVLSILSFIMALIPIIAFCAQNDSSSTVTASDGTSVDAAAGRTVSSSSSTLRSNQQTITRYIHQTTTHSVLPDITYNVDSAVLDSDRYGGYQQTFYVNGWWGWCYIPWRDFIENEQDYDGTFLYPLSDIRVNYGDRLIFRNYGWWARDPLVLVPRDIWSSCNFSSSEYASYYLDDSGNQQLLCLMTSFGSICSFFNISMMR